MFLMLFTYYRSFRDLVLTDDLYHHPTQVCNIFSMLILMHGDGGDNTICALQGNGRIYGDDGDDKVKTSGEAIFDIWDGSGNDEIDGQSECLIPHARDEAEMIESSSQVVSQVVALEMISSDSMIAME
jgi:hypothetical protein